MKHPIASLILSLMLGLVGSLSAADAEIPHITVEGVAEIEVTPDTLNWSVTVTNRGPETEKLALQQDATVTAALKTIRDAGVEKEAIQTSYTSLEENWANNNGASYRDGYIATTHISFKSRKTEQYRPLWSSLSKVTGVSIRSAYWETSDRIALRKKARTEAIQAARSKAEAMAADAGVTLLEPLAIEEIQAQTFYGNFNSNRIENESTGGSESGSVSQGKIKVTGHVSMRFRIGTR